MKYNIGMRSLNIISMTTYILCFGLAYNLWHRDMELVCKFGAVILTLILTFIIINTYEELQDED